MQHRVASIDEFVDAATLDEITCDPRDAGFRIALCTRQRAHHEAGPRQMLQKMSADETRRTGDRDATRALRMGRCVGLRQGPVPPAARDASAFSSDAAYMRRA